MLSTLILILCFSLAASGGDINTKRPTSGLPAVMQQHRITRNEAFYNMGYDMVFLEGEHLGNIAEEMKRYLRAVNAPAHLVEAAETAASKDEQGLDSLERAAKNALAEGLDSLATAEERLIMRMGGATYDPTKDAVLEVVGGPEWMARRSVLGTGTLTDANNCRGIRPRGALAQACRKFEQMSHLLNKEKLTDADQSLVEKLSKQVELLFRESDPVLGLYRGTATNTTVGRISGTLNIVVERTGGGRFSGYLELGAPLGGSGPFLALVRGDSVFIATASETGDSIVWSAPQTGSEVRGEYTVTSGPFTGQRGVWSVKLVSGMPFKNLHRD